MKIRNAVSTGNLQELERLSSKYDVQHHIVKYVLDEIELEMELDILKRVIEWLNYNDIDIVIQTLFDDLIFNDQFEKFQLVMNSNIQFATDYTIKSAISEAASLGSSGIKYLEFMEVKFEDEINVKRYDLSSAMKDENKDMYNFLSQRKGFDDAYEQLRDELFYDGYENEDDGLNYDDDGNFIYRDSAYMKGV